MPAYLSPIGNSQIVDVNGNPLNGGKIYTYLAGTSTPAGTWTTSAGTIAQTNPIILNSLGATANPIFLSAGVAYKFIIKDSTDVTTLYTFDNITGINDPSQVALSTPEWMPATFAISYVSGTVFSATGDQTLTLLAGMRVKTTNTGGTAYSRVLSSVFSLGFTTVTVLNDSLALDSGLSALSYSILSPTNPSLPNSQAVKDAMGIRQGRNLIVNGAFQINQDAAANSVTLAAGQYWRDGWKAHSAGCTLVYDPNFNQITISAGHLVQVIENPLRSNASDIYTLSIEGQLSATVNTGQGAPNTTGATSPKTIPYTNPNVFTDIGGDLYVIFGSGTFNAIVQLERGTSANKFEYKSLQQDLAECQRYHVRVTGIDGITGWGSGRQSSTTGSRIWINPPVAMYAKPTVVFSGVQLDYSGGITAATASTVYSSKNQVMMDVTHAAVGAASAGVGLQIPNGVANYIELNARL